MESRKIQTSASGSFFVTLPKSWVSATGLEKEGRVGMVVDEDGSLKLLLPKVRGKPLKFELKFDEFPRPTTLERYIKTCYIHGCDAISIFSERVITPDAKNLIKKSIMDLIGTEISEEYSDRMTIQTLVDPAKFSMDTLMQRIHTLVFSMHQDAIESFRKRDRELAADAIMREREVEKLYTLALRQLFIAIGNKEVRKGICAEKVWDCVMSAIAARELSRMGFYAVDIAKQTIEMGERKIDKSLMEQILKMSKIASRMSEDAMKAFFRGDFVLADEVISTLDEVRELDCSTDMKILEAKSSPHVAMILTTICRDLRRIASYAAAIAYDTQQRHTPTGVKE